MIRIAVLSRGAIRFTPAGVLTVRDVDTRGNRIRSRDADIGTAALGQGVGDLVAAIAARG